MSNATASLLPGQRPGAVRCWRNKNPGNLRPPAKRALHVKPAGIDTSPGGPFLIYASETDGWHDLADLLLQYQDWGWDTVDKIISRFAPVGDGNNVASYCLSVLAGLDLPRATRAERETSLHTVINVSVWRTMDVLTHAIAGVEGGAKCPAWPEASRVAGFMAAGLKP